MKRIRRVTRPMATTTTPVAMGSSVPAWPTLRTPVALRTRATTSWLVMPDALSTMRKPSVIRQSPTDLLDRRLGRPAEGEPGGVVVTAAAQLCRQTSNVDLSPRPQRRLDGCLVYH